MINLIWFLIGAVSSVMIFIFIRNNSGTELTAEDYREDLIHSYYDKIEAEAKKND